MGKAENLHLAMHVLYMFSESFIVFIYLWAKVSSICAELRQKENIFLFYESTNLLRANSTK